MLCQNPDCNFADRCPLRLREDTKTITAIAGEKRALPSRATVRCETLQFSLRLGDNIGWIGILRVDGIVEDKIVSQLRKLEQDELPTLAGLLVIYNSAGGSYLAGEALERFVLVARQDMPVVSYVRNAQSTAILPMVAADAVFGDRGATTGGFGMVYLFCDGREPSAIVSRQTPEKLPGPGIPWPPRCFGDAEKKDILQLSADDTCSRDLSMIAGYTGRAVEKLAPYLDGRTLTEEEAVESGLIEKICPEDEAYKMLLTLAEKPKNQQHNEIKGKNDGCN